MPKRKAKAAAAANSASPKKLSKLKLILLASAPLALAGAGYAGWIFGAPALGLGSDPEGGDGKDAIHVAALPLEIRAENSFTYTFALSELLKGLCGATPVPELQAASAEEAKADGMLANHSWIAANRRASALTEESCGKILAEIDRGEIEAIELAKAKARGEEKPTAHH